MIKLYDKSNREIRHEMTVFPDGTSQFWKYSSVALKDLAKILWLFENEGEFAQLSQIIWAARELGVTNLLELNVPYLPYARQDKDFAENNTWALEWFLMTLGVDFERVVTYDAHSFKGRNFINLQSVEPKGFHFWVLEKTKYDFICFPDVGAANRYDYLIGMARSRDIGVIVVDKERDQATGNITEINLRSSELAAGVRGGVVLIVDDICDGGATFVRLAEPLKAAGLTKIDLAVSHGLFSKGIEPLRAAGIDMIYTTNSLLRNKAEFPVW